MEDSAHQLMIHTVIFLLAGPFAGMSYGNAIAPIIGNSLGQIPLTRLIHSAHETIDG